MKMMTDEQSKVIHKLHVLANNDAMLVEQALKECQKWKKKYPSWFGRFIGRKAKWVRSADIRDVIDYIKKNRPPYWVPSNIP